MSWVGAIGRRPSGRLSLGCVARMTALRQYAAELVSLAPDVILTVAQSDHCAVYNGRPAQLPIVFVNVADPVGSGFVQSLARPGGNATGFLNFEYSISGKWLDLLKQVAPRMTRVAVLRDPTTASGIGQYGAIQAVAQSLGVELSPFGVRDLDEIDRRSDDIRAHGQWRLDRDGWRAGCSSQADH